MYIKSKKPKYFQFAVARKDSISACILDDSAKEQVTILTALALLDIKKSCFLCFFTTKIATAK